MARFHILVLGAATLLTIDGLDNGLGLTPQRGYNSWYDRFMSPSEDALLATAQALKDKGLWDKGFIYANLDDGMVAAARAANGSLLPDPKFPHGFRWLSGQLHAMGMKFGIYTDRGTKTCGGRPSAQGFEKLDAATYALDWQVDYVKEDSCNAPTDHQTAFAEYALMRDGLNASGRPVFMSLCGWEMWYGSVGAALGNSFRIGPDDTNWGGVLANIDIMADISTFGGPGAINDPCLLLGADMNGKEAVTELQSRAQFSMWATIHAPLLLSQTVTNMSANRLETYSNTEVLAVSADAFGRQGVRLAGGPLSAEGTPLSGTYRNPSANRRLAPKWPAADPPLVMQACGSPLPAEQVWHWNVTAPGFLTNGGGLCANLDDCGNDLIGFSCVTQGGTCCGANCYNNEIWTLSSTDGSLRSAMSPALAVTDPGNSRKLTLATFTGAANQRFTYDAPSGALHGSSGLCLTLGSSAPPNITNVWGRPLIGGAWAITFLNAGSNVVDISCSVSDGCLVATGWEAAQPLLVRDLWAHAMLPNTTAGVGFTAKAVPANGGVVMLTLSPYFGVSNGGVLGA